MRVRYQVIWFMTVFLLACSSGNSTSTGLFTGDTVTQGDETSPEDGISVDVTLEDLPTAPTRCEAGDTMCLNGKLAECHELFGWLLEVCPEGTKCDEGACVASACEPLTARCDGNSVEICSPDGTGWSKGMPCPEEKVCQEGTCVAPNCEPGTSVCADQKVLTCADDGLSWFVTPCGDAEICFDGQCIECVKDADCPAGKSCVDGLCMAPELEWVTKSLPDGVVGEEYQAQLAAKGGVEPYFFDLVEGELPAGLTLDSEAGTLTGTPENAGTIEVTFEVSDDLGTAENRTFIFEVYAPPTSVVITTNSPLPGGEEGESYNIQLEATGGLAPYTWGIKDGALPAGLVLNSNGNIAGVLADHGTFTFTVKAFDNSDVVGVGTKTFELTITVAPLEIIGGTEYDLWVTKVIVLPLITTVEIIPIPYSTQLEAKGGVKPYHWSEQPLPSFIEYLISNGGLPAGLVLEEDGQLHGSTTDTEKVVKVAIPFTGIELTGYFFVGQVEDSQDSPDSDWAIYLIPTVPVAF